MSLGTTLDNGGSEISRYELYRDEGDLSSPVNVKIDDYDGFGSLLTVTGLTAGKRYRFDFIAVNEYGNSPESFTLTVAASTLPDPPTDIVIDWDLSTKTSLNVKWSDPVNTPASPILGYVLYIDDGDGGQFSVAYDGSVFPGITNYSVENLTNGLLYRFKARSLNYNGFSEYSEIASYYACTSPT